MILSELVKLKIELKKYADLTAYEDESYKVTDDLKSIRATIADEILDTQISELVGIVKTQTYLTKKMFHSKHMLINEIIHNEIEAQTTKYFQQGYNVCRSDERNAAGSVIPLPPDLRALLLGRIQLYTDWHYPGLEIGPNEGEFTPHLVGCDPLYLVDVQHKYLDAVVAQFTPEYQARVRTYCIGNGVNEKGLSELPDDQFGFVFSWDNFNYLPFDEIRKYLVDVARVLRPGGTFLFSFNDGEMYNGARHVEWGGMSYVPKSLLVTLVESYGLEVAHSFGFDTDWHNISWLEVKKPGTLSTIKAHQTLGIVKDIEQ